MASYSNVMRYAHVSPTFMQRWDTLHLIKPTLFKIAKGVGLKVSTGDRRDAISTILRNWLSRLFDHWYQSLERIPSNLEVPLDRQELHSAHTSLLTLFDYLVANGVATQQLLSVSEEPLYGLGPPERHNDGSYNSSNQRGYAKHSAAAHTATSSSGPNAGPSMTRASTALPIVNPNSMAAVQTHTSTTYEAHQGPQPSQNRGPIPNSIKVATGTPSSAQIIANMAPSTTTARTLPVSITSPNSQAANRAHGAASNGSVENGGWTNATGNHSNANATHIHLPPGQRPAAPYNQYGATPQSEIQWHRFTSPSSGAGAATTSMDAQGGAGEASAKKRGRPRSIANPALEDILRTSNVRLDASEDPFWRVYAEDPITWTVLADKWAGSRTISGKPTVGTSTVIRSYQLTKSRMPPSASFWESSMFMIQEWPPGVSIRVNQRPTDLTKFRKSEKYKKTKDSFLDITAMLDHGGFFSIQLDIPTQIKASYLIIVQSMFPITVDDLVEKVSSNPSQIITIPQSKEFIQKSLFKSNDMILTQQVSLKDPLSMSRIGIPVRSVSCLHWGCFDLTLYLQANKNIRTWLCPRCDKPAPFHTLRLDQYFQECLKSFENETDLLLHPDCSLTRKSDSMTPVVQKKAVEASVIHVISLDSDDEGDDETTMAAQPPPRSPGVTSPNNAMQGMAVFSSVPPEPTSPATGPYAYPAHIMAATHLPNSHRPQLSGAVAEATPATGPSNPAHYELSSLGPAGVTYLPQFLPQPPNAIPPNAHYAQGNHHQQALQHHAGPVHYWSEAQHDPHTHAPRVLPFRSPPYPPQQPQQQQPYSPQHQHSQHPQQQQPHQPEHPPYSPRAPSLPQQQRPLSPPATNPFSQMLSGQHPSPPTAQAMRAVDPSTTRPQSPHPPQPTHAQVSATTAMTTASAQGELDTSAQGTTTTTTTIPPGHGEAAQPSDVSGPIAGTTAHAQSWLNSLSIDQSSDQAGGGAAAAAVSVAPGGPGQTSAAPQHSGATLPTAPSSIISIESTPSTSASASASTPASNPFLNAQTVPLELGSIPGAQPELPPTAAASEAATSMNSSTAAATNNTTVTATTTSATAIGSTAPATSDASSSSATANAPAPTYGPSPAPTAAAAAAAAAAAVAKPSTFKTKAVAAGFGAFVVALGGSSSSTSSKTKGTTRDVPIVLDSDEE